MKERIYSIDLFRILMVVFILLFHSNIHLNCQYGILTTFISQSAIFMVAFFMLSGFALYYTYYDRETDSISDTITFYIKRLIKIYPLYLFIYIAYLIFFNSLSLTKNLVIAPIELLLLQSFFSSLFNVLNNGGTWFLSCLFFCYLLFPWLKGLVLKLQKKKLLFWGLYFISSLSPLVAKVFSTRDLYSNPFYRLIEFFLGMMIADLVLKNKTKIKRYLAVPIILEMLILIISVSLLSAYFTNDYTMYNFITVPVFALLIYHLSGVHNQFVINISKNSVTQYLNAISFPFYLAQTFTFKIMPRIKSMPWFGTYTNGKLISVTLLINLVITVLLYEAIQKPVEKWLSPWCRAHEMQTDKEKTKKITRRK